MESLIKLKNKYPEVKALYGKWSQMKSRCYKSNTHNYKWYGGKGITICDEWLESFEDFAMWCLSNGYRKGMAISRKGDTGQYNPDNCKILTMSQNSKDMIKNNDINKPILLSKEKSLIFFDSIQEAARWLISKNIPNSVNSITVGSFLSNTISGYNGSKLAYGYSVKYI